MFRSIDALLQKRAQMPFLFELYHKNNRPKLIGLLFLSIFSVFVKFVVCFHSI